MSLSFAVTAYNEMTENRAHGKRILGCLHAAQEHTAIDEIVVVDDGSDDYPRLLVAITGAHITKARVSRNVVNRGVFGNKLESVARCKNDWVIMCDSDNTKDKAHIDKVLSLPLVPDTWYCPSFARPDFDYRHLVGEYDLAGFQRIIDQPMFECACNTGNQVVHRKRYMEVFGTYRSERADLMMPNWLDIPEAERSTIHWRLVFDALDSFIFNMEWLSAGGRLAIAEGLEYDHFCDGSTTSNYNRAPEEKTALAAKLLQELKRRRVAANDNGQSFMMGL